MRLPFVFWFGVLAAVLGGGGCQNPAGTPAQTAAGPGKVFTGKHPIKIVCTTGMVADLVRNVGGSHVQVTALMGAGVDPHLYKASPGDASRLNAADAVFYSGLHLEGKMSDLFVRMARQKPTTAVTEALEDQHVLEDESGAFDPHLWFDVSLWSRGAGVVCETLVAYDPPHAEDYRRNCAEYQGRLAELHQFAIDQIATIPESQRVLVTAHDAFRYFGRAYKIEVRGIQGISTESEAGVKQINELVGDLVKRKIKAVFVETSVSDINVRSLVDGCGSHGHPLKIGGALYSDAMGTEGTPEGTYEGMIRHNVQTIVRALK